ncbi:MAG TPA: hypothetical protein VJB99_01915 [Patescibacteria group bacterium]|nr:hypothetical protein [Patescibacteria group bacterium]
MFVIPLLVAVVVGCGKNREIVIVPDLSGPEIVNWVDERLGLTKTREHIQSSLIAWNFLQGERGKKFEVQIWYPGWPVPSDEVRAHFRKNGGFVGNTAAFLAWIGEHDPDGYWTSIPEDERLRRDPESGVLFAPDFFKTKKGRGIGLISIEGNVDDHCWDARWWFVAFREIP